MFILEGPDGVGKSTAAVQAMMIASRIAPHFSGYFELKHMSKPGEHFNFGSDYFLEAHSFQIRDRFHIGEEAYGTSIYGMRCSHDHLRLVDGRVRSMGGFTAILYGNSQWYRRHVELIDRKEMFSVEQRVCVNDFYAMYDSSYRPVSAIDGTFEVGRVAEQRFLPLSILEKWVRQWIRRLEVAEKLKFLVYPPITS